MYIGISLSVIAISVFISSKISLGKNYSPCYDQRVPKTMTTSGFYKYINYAVLGMVDGVVSARCIKKRNLYITC